MDVSRRLSNMMQLLAHSRILSRLRDNPLGLHLMKGALGSLLIQGGFAGLSFANALVLARLLGPSEYGAYANAVAWVSVLAVIGAFGFDILLVRNVASYRALHEFAELKGLLHFADRFVLIFSLFLAGAFLAVAGFYVFAQAEAAIRVALWWSMPLIPLFALIYVYGSALRGLEHVIYARLPFMILRPGLSLLVVLGIALVHPGKLGLPLAMAVSVGATMIALGVALFWRNKFVPSEVAQAKPSLKIRPWMKAGLMLVIFGSVQVLFGQIGTIMLGTMGSAADVGLFSVASRLAYMLAFSLVAVEMILAPVVSRLNATGERKTLQVMLTRTVQIAFIVTLLPVLVLTLWGSHVLEWFGHEYALGQTPLTILVVGQLINVATGSGAVVLFMLGDEHIVAVVYVAVTLLSLVLYAIAIPRYGIVGVAIVSSIGVIVLNLLLSLLTRKRSGLHATILGEALRFI